VNRQIRLSLLGLVLVCAASSTARAQNQYIGYVYPAGGQQGTTFPIRLGGQNLSYASELVVSGEGVSVRFVDYYRVVNNEEQRMLTQQLEELKKKKDVKLDDPLVAKMAWFEFPAPIGPWTGPEPVLSLHCPICGTANLPDAAICTRCNAALDKPKEPSAGDKDSKLNGAKSEHDIAKEKLIDRIQRRFSDDERNPAVRSQTELVYAEVTIDPNAKPGRREIRLVTKRGISNPLPFYVGQVPEVSRKPMKTCTLPTLGKEHLAQRKRPVDEEEVRVKLPCTMNGQIAPGEVNRYRFPARKGQRLVISTKARDLVPYVADGVPGWFQAVLKLCDSRGQELAYNDDFRFNPDPLIYFEVPADGEYLLLINEALYRGRESFVYRITIDELPYVTSVFPLGGRVGEPLKLQMDGWNLGSATLSLPPADAKPGRHWLSAVAGKHVSNEVPFALDTLPESLEQEPNHSPAQAQKVTLPVIINGRVDRPGDWDVFEVAGQAGDTLVAEVTARRLGSPLDSFVKITNAAGQIIAFNDDHYDAGSGLNTDHADSYVMAKLPAAGKYFVHLGDTRRHAGKEYAYRLRLSNPLQDFSLVLMPSRLNIRGRTSAGLTVYALRKDGFDGPIKLSFKDLPVGFEATSTTIAAKQEVGSISLKSNLLTTDKPVNVTVIGTAKAGDRELVHEAVPAEDKMQAFLWRHLLPADNLPVVVFDPGYQPPADRVRPAIRDEDRPKDIKPNLTRTMVETYLRQLDALYQEWLLTDEFVNREIAIVEARLIK